jgi:hypothetical protein
MINNKDDATPKMKTLSESVNEAIAKGFTENFKVVAAGLSTEDDQKIYSEKEVTISNFYRFEGYSDPQDNSILYLIETHDGKKGMLIDAYGAQADAGISSFIHNVKDISKKKNGV